MIQKKLKYFSYQAEEMKNQISMFSNDVKRLTA